MEKQYKRACAAYLAKYIKKEHITNNRVLYGWYDQINSPDFNTVGYYITAQMLILIKDAELQVDFDCMPMVDSLLSTQNKDGGWSYRVNLLMSATEPTVIALLAIVLWCSPLTEMQQRAVESGIEWLLHHQNRYCLWGPINKKVKYASTSVSCTALSCLNRIMNIANISNRDEILKTVECGCKSLLDAFDDNDLQCGWGITVRSSPTICHTAMVVNTLVSIRNDYKDTHQIIKAGAFLKKYHDELKQSRDLSNIRIGDTEIYQHKASRLSFYHSVDVYLLSALLRANIVPFSEIEQEYMALVDSAEHTDWRYRNFVTAWRLYDVVSFCNLCEVFYNNTGSKNMRHFKIALTFAGETRPLVEQIAEILSTAFSKSEILYDRFHEAEFARPQLDSYLQELYHNHADLIVVFICPQYPKKKWCGVEWRAIRDILNNMEYSKIMYVKATPDNIEDLTLPGFYASEDGFVDSRNHTPQEIAGLIIQRFNQQYK